MDISKREKITTGWGFCKKSIDTYTGMDPAQGMTEQDFPVPGEFRPVRIPHDWMIENESDLYEDSVGWYRFCVGQDAERKPAWRSLVFDGVYMNSTIYVNHEEVFSWKYGYSSFEVPIGRYLQDGENEILVRVVYQNPNSRWYSGAGIFRNVWMVTGGPVHIGENGIYIHSDKNNNSYQSKIRVALEQPSGDGPEYDGGLEQYCPLSVEACILGDQDEVIACQTVGVTDWVANLELECRDVQEWSLATPKLYRLRVSVRNAQEEVCEEREIRFGFRTIAFDAQDGFRLNGERVKFQGVCVHHDHGALGAAVHVSSIRRRLCLLRRMGVNAIRCAHNMPSREFLDLCDEQGFLVMDEAFDCWENHKTDYDYASYFREWHEKDMKSFVERDRNHPCVILWSVGNEIADTHIGERGMTVMKRLMEIVEQYDPLQNARVTLASNYMAWENTQRCADVIKLIGYNYTERLYEEHHREHPDWMIYGSETGSVVQSRGIYHFPMEQEILSDDDEQCSSLGNSITSWGAKSIESSILAEKRADYSMGQFLWSGFDYIGEPTPYHTRNSYFGQLDTAGFPKDSYELFRAAWTDGKKEPFVHLFPDWDFNEGQIIDVRACTNADSLKVWLNGKLVGAEENLGDKSLRYGGAWKVAYEPGVLRAVAYDETGRVVASMERHSYRDPVRLRLTVEEGGWIPGDEPESLTGACAFLWIEALDEDGNVVENAVNDVAVTVAGGGRLAALDNGDATDRLPYRSHHRRLFSGKLLAVIEHDDSERDVTVRAVSKEINGITSVIDRDGYLRDVQDDVDDEKLKQELTIPVRKIALTGQNRELTPEHADGILRAVVHPAVYSGGEIRFRVCDVNGVDSPIADITAVEQREDGIYVSYRAKGDGQFRIRGMWQEADGRVSALSQLECASSGFGACNLDPYSFLSASLYSLASEGITNGNERGIATSREQNSYVVFDRLDFGSFGSDTVTIPVFSFGGTVPFRFWNGVPYGEGSRVIGECVYSLPGVWNTYVEDTFVLQERLRGICTFAMELDTKVHIKGFRFHKLEKAYTELTAAEADHLYGDSYRIVADCVVGIGNNVTLEYTDMDFGANGSDRLVIQGRTMLPKNPVRLIVMGDTSYTEDLSFRKHSDYTDCEFPIPRITGNCTVSFVFMPGSQFDMKSICFRKGGGGDGTALESGSAG